MRTPEGYKTRQRYLVEQCLKENRSRHLTVDDVIDLLRKNGCEIGRTTVYRTLEKMAAEGKAQKYTAAGGSACFQFLENGKLCSEHFHLKCSVCGRLLHLECEQVDLLCKHIFADHGFSIDRSKTVLYGVCEQCAKGISE